jgi:hypothetical protein
MLRLPALLLLLLMMVKAHAHALPVLALNERGKYHAVEMSLKEYTESLQALKQAFDQQLQTSAGRPASGNPYWQLHKISFGLAVTGEIGIGPYRYGKALKQRLIYGRRP